MPLTRLARARFAAGAVVAVVAMGMTGAEAQTGTAPPQLADLVSQTFRAAYNLDQDEAIALGRRAVQLAPEEPSAHRALAAVLWVNILFRRGAVTIDNYLGSVTKSLQMLPRTPPELDAEFKRELGLAISLAESRLARNPRDLQARFEAGNAYALQASYTASVEGSLVAAFRTARKAYDAQEQVLEREPQRTRAGVVVGTYRYMIAGMSLPSRLLAYMAGFGGGKEKGISLVESASRDPESHADATIALLLIYTREGRHTDALKLIRALAAEFPRNRLLVLEEGAVALRAGRPAEAEATLSRGLAAFDADPRPKMPGERALWLYKRGAARVLLNRPAEAQADLAVALQNNPIEWVRGRLNLELGKLADLGGRRPEALAFYRLAETTAKTSNDPLGAAEAGRLLKRPFTAGSRTP
jgi:tetratricopeptide (TPR) repeat protein